MQLPFACLSVLWFGILTAVTPGQQLVWTRPDGVAWATAHVQKQLGDAEEESAYRAVDEALLAHLNESPWRNDYDLISGLIGFGVYALERLPHPMGFEMLERVVDRLDETAERNAEGITWLTRPELLPPWQRELSPNGYYNLGLAHGVPGVIALLGQACAAGIARAQVEPLLEGAIDWLLAQRLPASGAHSIFPSWVGPCNGREGCRLAWCYGDAGIAAALLSAARCAREPSWERKALEIASRAARRPSPAPTSRIGPRPGSPSASTTNASVWAAMNSRGVSCVIGGRPPAANHSGGALRLRPCFCPWVMISSDAKVDFPSSPHEQPNEFPQLRHL